MFCWRHSRLAVIFGLILLVVISADSWAGQAIPATLRFRVADAQGLALPGATCTVSNARTPPVLAVSDTEGLAVVQIPAGTYSIHVDLVGFGAYAKDAVKVGEGDTVDWSVRLEPAFATSVTVSAGEQREQTVASGTVPTASLSMPTLKRLPLDVAVVGAALPLVPGVVRSATGEITIKGASEEQSAFVVNGLTASDPATGGFRLRLPVDAVEAMQVFIHPYTAEYGQFTGGLTNVHTRSGGDHWHAEVNDFLPDLRFVNGRVVGIAADTPHVNVNGPLVPGRLLLSQSASYQIEKRPVRGLVFPHNETRTEAQSYFTQLDATFRPGHRQTVTFGSFPARHDFVGLDVFRPQLVTPSAEQHDVVAAVKDESVIGSMLLSSAVSFTGFDTDVWPQGPSNQRLTPLGEEGNYFASQQRRAHRREILEVLTLPTRHWHGGHDLKVGVEAAFKAESLSYTARPVEIVRMDGTVARRIDFQATPAMSAHNREYVGFVQDRWSLSSQATVDLGLRYEDQQIADASVVAPRIGIAWAPGGGATVLHGGAGFFYGALPLNLRAFGQYPRRTITWYAPDGTVLNRVELANLLVGAGSTPPPGSGDADTEQAFVPENLTWNLQVDRRVNPWLALRASFTSSVTENTYVVDRASDSEQRGYLALKSNGRADYRALEFTARVGNAERGLNLSYTRSRAMADLNEFSAVLGDFSGPLIYPNQYTRTASDVPNRFIAWGTVALPRRFTIAPVLELRSGFPYTVVREDQTLAGVRNSDATRFPTFFALDLEASKDLRVSHRFSVRLSISIFNVTNHFNPRDVRANLADPQFGSFLASYRRYASGGFDILF
jgi:hypothetical protein